MVLLPCTYIFLQITFDIFCHGVLCLLVQVVDKMMVRILGPFTLWHTWVKPCSAQLRLGMGCSIYIDNMDQTWIGHLMSSLLHMHHLHRAEDIVIYSHLSAILQTVCCVPDSLWHTMEWELHCESYCKTGLSAARIRSRMAKCKCGVMRSAPKLSPEMFTYVNGPNTKYKWSVTLLLYTFVVYVFKWKY